MVSASDWVGDQALQQAQMNAAPHFAVRSRQFPDGAGVQPNDPLPLGYRPLPAGRRCRFWRRGEFGGEAHPREDLGGVPRHLIKRVVGVGIAARSA